MPKIVAVSPLAELLRWASVVWRFGKGRRFFALSGAWLAGALFAAGAAEAAQPAQRYAVKWSTTEGADSCLQQAELTAAVAKLISAEQLTALEQAERVIFGSVRHDDSWRATLTVVDAAGNALGEREIKSDATSCSELGASVALAIALIIDPDHVALAAKAPEADVASAAPEQIPGVAPAPATNVQAAEVSRALESSIRVPEFSPRPWRSVKAGAVVLAGLLPEIAVGAQLEYWQPLVAMNSLRFSLAYFGAQTIDVPRHDGVSATLYLVTARAAYCPQLTGGPEISVFACAGLESGLMVAHGQGGGYDSTPARGLFALDGALTVDRSLAGPWALSLTAGAALTPFRPPFSYLSTEGPIEVHQRGILEGRLEIGLAYRF